MFDDTIQFRFVTRTKFQDYRVFINGGKDTLSNREGFRPLRQYAYVMEGRPCAALFERSGKIYLLASSLSRGKVDERGRGITFSFCWIFPTTQYKQRARYAFIRLIDHWEEAEDWLNENLHDINEGSESEGVELDENAFTRWLLDGFNVNSEVRFKTVSDEAISVRSFKSVYIWPKQDYIFRYDKNDNCIENRTIGQEEDITGTEPVHTEKSPRTRAKKILAGLGAGVVLAGSGFAGGYTRAVNSINEKLKDTVMLSDVHVIAKSCAEDIIGVLSSHDITSADTLSDDIEKIIMDIIIKNQDKKKL